MTYGREPLEPRQVMPCPRCGSWVAYVAPNRITTLWHRGERRDTYAPTIAGRCRCTAWWRLDVVAAQEGHAVPVEIKD